MKTWTGSYLDHLEATLQRKASYVGRQQFDELCGEPVSLYVHERNARVNDPKSVLHKDYAFDDPYLSNKVLEWFDLTGYSYDFYYWERPSTIDRHRQLYFLLMFRDVEARKLFELSFKLA